LLALVPAAASAGSQFHAISSGLLQQQQQQVIRPAAGGVVTRRQLLKQVKEEEDVSGSVWARPEHQQLQAPEQQLAADTPAVSSPSTVHWQHTTPQKASGSSGEEHAEPAADDAAATATAAAAAAAGAVGEDGEQAGSPVQPVLLGPDGPVLVLSQRALQTAMSQSAALATTPRAAAGVADIQQEVGMLMRVVDHAGNVQLYFLPQSSQEANDAVGAAGEGAVALAATAAPVQQLPMAAAVAMADVSVEDVVASNEAGSTAAQQQQSEQTAPAPYQLRNRTVHSLQGTGLAQLPDADEMVLDQTSSRRQLRTPRDEQQQQQQQAPRQSQAPPAAGAGRSLRSLSAGATTPVKRATPTKRKADDVDGDPDQQVGMQVRSLTVLLARSTVLYAWHCRALLLPGALREDVAEQLP
jgi:hypothetical protein